MNIEGTIAQCKSLLLQGKQINTEKVDSPIEAASTFSEKNILGLRLHRASKAVQAEIKRKENKQ